MAKKVIVTTAKSLEPHKLSALCERVAKHLSIPVENVLALDGTSVTVVDVGLADVIACEILQEQAAKCGLVELPQEDGEPCDTKFPA